MAYFGDAHALKELAVHVDFLIFSNDEWGDSSKLADGISRWIRDECHAKPET